MSLSVEAVDNIIRKARDIDEILILNDILISWYSLYSATLKDPEFLGIVDPLLLNISITHQIGQLPKLWQQPLNNQNIEIQRSIRLERDENRNRENSEILRYILTLGLSISRKMNTTQ